MFTSRTAMLAVAVAVAVASVVMGASGQACTWRAPDNTFFDLSGITRMDNAYTISEAAPSGFGSYDYYINVCDNATGDSGKCANNSAPACQYINDPFQSYSVDLGQLSTQTFYDLNATAAENGDGVMVRYSNGDVCTSGLRSAEIELVCDYDGGTVLRNVEETVRCTYVFTITSPHACPAQCPRGFRGGNCTTCMNGYYGPTCEACDCQFGTCNDTMGGDGTCACEKGWTGPECKSCTAEFCSHTSDDKFVYDLAGLAEEDYDLTYVDASTNYAYYVNVLSRVNEDGCGGAGVCQEAFGEYKDLGLADFVTVGDLGDGSGGVTVNYYNGTPCEIMPGLKRSSSLNLVCDHDAATPAIVGVLEGPTCHYTFTINAAEACPVCADNQTMYGPSCATCDCNGGMCNATIAGDGACNCTVGRSGRNCEECQPDFYGDDCLPCPCEGHSICFDGKTGSGDCVCVAGWSGPKCDKNDGSGSGSDNGSDGSGSSGHIPGDGGDDGLWNTTTIAVASTGGIVLGIVIGILIMVTVSCCRGKTQRSRYNEIAM